MAMEIKLLVVVVVVDWGDLVLDIALRVVLKPLRRGLTKILIFFFSVQAKGCNLFYCFRCLLFNSEATPFDFEK